MDIDLVKPSSVEHGDLYKVRIYTDDSADPHVYDRVKHLWMKGNSSLLCLLHYFSDGTYRYVYWPMVGVRWFQMTPATYGQDG